MSFDGLTFVTGSDAKLREAERILGVKIQRVSLDLPEVQETDVQTVVQTKARAAWQALGGRPVLVEDTGLALDAWNGLPGALIKWFVRSVQPAGICRMANGFADRSATATTIVGLCDGGEVRTFAGRVRGCIAAEPLGSGGFGWDAIFIPESSNRTFAQMDAAEKDRYSMRRIAFEAAAVALHPSGRG